MVPYDLQTKGHQYRVTANPLKLSSETLISETFLKDQRSQSTCAIAQPGGFQILA